MKVKSFRYWTRWSNSSRWVKISFDKYRNNIYRLNGGDGETVFNLDDREMDESFLLGSDWT